MKSLKGRYLIASPKLLDPNFYRSVLLMVQHDKNGAMGLILNRPAGNLLKDVWPQVSETPCGLECPIFLGGPCEGPLMLVHDNPAFSQIEPAKGLHFAVDEEDVQWLVANGKEPIKAFVGYAGWSAGQLESELAEGSWLVAEADTDGVLGDVPQWDRLVSKIIP